MRPIQIDLRRSYNSGSGSAGQSSRGCFSRSPLRFFLLLLLPLPRRLPCLRPNRALLLEMARQRLRLGARGRLRWGHRLRRGRLRLGLRAHRRSAAGRGGGDHERLGASHAAPVSTLLVPRESVLEGIGDADARGLEVSLASNLILSDSPHASKTLRCTSKTLRDQHLVTVHTSSKSHAVVVFGQGYGLLV